MRQDDPDQVHASRIVFLRTQATLQSYLIFNCDFAPVQNAFFDVWATRSQAKQDQKNTEEN
jgi:hypothetical protein